MFVLMTSEVRKKYLLYNLKAVQMDSFFCFIQVKCFKTFRLSKYLYIISLYLPKKLSKYDENYYEI